jgi:hypothetical protein
MRWQSLRPQSGSDLRSIRQSKEAALPRRRGASTESRHSELIGKALALAHQLHSDFNELKDFHTELYHLSFLHDTLRRLRNILIARFPPDLRRAANIQHGDHFDV